MSEKVKDGDLARQIFYAVMDDLCDRRGVRQSVLGEMYSIMRFEADEDSDDNGLIEIARLLTARDGAEK